MNRADNSAFLAQANARRHQAALAAAHHAIDQLRREGKPVTYAAVAHAAGVSRTWLYSQEQIRDLISDLRQHEPPAAALTAQRASTSSLRQRLDTACAEITRLRTENRSLRDQLARQLGLHRMQPVGSTKRPPSRNDTGTGHSRNCGLDMSTPQKPSSTRHDTKTTPDNRRSGGKSQSADMPSEPHPNGVLLRYCADTHRRNPMCGRKRRYPCRRACRGRAGPCRRAACRAEQRPGLGEGRGGRHREEGPALRHDLEARTPPIPRMRSCWAARVLHMVTTPASPVAHSGAV
jgi:hypothetical protein